MYGYYNFKEVDPDFLSGADKDAIQVVDIRTEAEVARGVIDGAIHIPMHLLPIKAQDLPQDKPVVLYCHSGARSSQACAFMASKGFNNMHNLTGGILAWARSGKPIALPS
ncbi:MAG: rhodanese-like domain-containing protein [Hydrogenophilales bacterium]|nr:rhodanese-like domain-containing protein [Hydrogenophilales bacterium]